jgi:hypothetical protein
MRYLKTFESVDLENDLRDFCETYLAYLLDGDFELSVIWQGRDNLIGPNGLQAKKDHYIINLCRLNYEEQAIGFNWLEVKDYFIPFIHMLDKQYEIMDDTETYRRAGATDEPCISLYNGSQNFCVSIEDVLSGESLPHRYDEVPLLQISIRVEMKKITESIELNIDEVEHYLAYLIDEGFEVKPIIPGGGFADVKPQQAICLERKLSREEWQSILKTGLEHKSVIVGVRSEPMKVHNPSQFKPAVLLSNFKCNLLDSIEYLAQDATDKLLLSLSDQFSTTKIIMSFKVGAGHVQQYNFGDISIRLQIILID